MPDCTSRDNQEGEADEKAEEDEEEEEEVVVVVVDARTGPVISEKSFPRHSPRHSAFPSFLLALFFARALLRIKRPEPVGLEPVLFKRKEESRGV